LAEILAFWTGADAVPPCGFSQKLTMEFYSRGPEEHRRLPSASTCALTLWLPRNIQDPDELWRMLTDALTMSAGFGKL